MPPTNPPGDQRDWYLILEIDPRADTAAIKAAHRRLARDLHPDVNNAHDATQRMAELNRARDVLLDSAARAEFDRGRIRQRMTASPGPMRRPPATAGMGRMKFSFGVDDGAAPPRTAPRRNMPPRQKDAETLAREAARWRFDPRGGLGQEDWYTFLGVHPWSNAGEIQAAVKAFVGQASARSLSPAEQETRHAKLRMAWDVLGNRHKRSDYDAARPPWQPGPDLMDFYAFLGVRRGAGIEEISAAVTEKSRGIGEKTWNLELRKRDALLREAWWILRDPARRTVYDKALGRG
jgi:DnaJ-class molecular chaperone